MHNKTLIDQARAHILNGDTQRALETLLPLNDHTIQVLTAAFMAIKEEIVKNTLSFDEAQREYSKVNDKLLQRINDIEKGVPTGPANSSRQWLIPVALLAGLLGLAVFAWQRYHKTDEFCPVFAGKQGLKIVVFHLQKTEGEPNPATPPSTALLDQIGELTQKRDIPVQIRLYQAPADKIYSSDERESLAANCGADMVIHGSFNTITQDSMSVKLEYRFFENGGAHNVLRESIPLKGSMRTLRSLEDVVYSICSQIAAYSGQKETARLWLSKVKQEDAATEEPLHKALEH